MINPLRAYPNDVPGYPDRSETLDALPGFMTPPPGYGEVPFWWWTGDDLDVDRMLSQVREVHKKGISGLQVNYSHDDTPGWMTDSGEPKLFTDSWWKVYSRISEACGRLDMGIGLSTYTVDWPNGSQNLFHKLFYAKPELNAVELVSGERQRLCDGETKAVACVDGVFAARAYEVKRGVLQRGGLDLASRITDSVITWTAPDGEWEIWTFGAVRKDGTMNPLMAGAGDTIIQGFYQPFQDHNPGKASKGLNYFFNDELQVGLGKFAWNPDFAVAFFERKGYDLFEVLPAMWVDMGDITPKVRIDYADVRMSLMEERYFEPIYNWHVSRGILYGCDNNGRGLDPDAYGDYYRAIRWYTAPGHDTPGGKADLIKGKVSSSIGNLYQLPRVQLEGYHSLGWGATTECMMEATCKNFLYGCNLFSLHGFYYTTYGSHWEWAPPCYHFRMPYWEHMGTFLKYFERLSYLMSQGHHVCDVAVIYPVTPYEAEMNGERACNTAFDIGRKLMGAGINFDFIDHQSLARAVVEHGRLVVKEAKASYKALIFPDMDAVRWDSVEKGAAFAAAGGKVLLVGEMPTASDRDGCNDAALSSLNEQAFALDCRMSTADDAVEVVRSAFVQDVCGQTTPVLAQHRKVGSRDVYMVMGASPGDIVEFRSKGRVELWDAWTGHAHSLNVVNETATGTQVELPLEAYEAQVVVISPTLKQDQTPGVYTSHVRRRKFPLATLTDAQWRVSFEPTMDNGYGDFRLPVTQANTTIGVEARRFAWARVTPEHAKSAMLPEINDSSWQTELHGYGPQFYLLGPVPACIDPSAIDAELARLTRVNPTVAISIDGQDYHWQTYEFSWRNGKEGDLGHQGFHGLKGSISDNFIRLGRVDATPVTGTILKPDTHSRYYLWSCAQVVETCDVDLCVSQPSPAGTHASPVNAPAAVFMDGQPVTNLSETRSLQAGTHPILLRYEDYGESHVVLRRTDIPQPKQTQALAMRWYKDPGVIPFSLYAGEVSAEWFRFLSAPGTTAITLQTPSQKPVQAWIDGEPMVDQGNGRFEARTPRDTAAVVALRLTPPVGQSGGAAIPEPIKVETHGNGIMPLGDWSTLGILNNYSGGVRYRTTFELTEQDVQGKIEIDLGSVTATAEVHINGKAAGIRVAPPWTLDVSGLLQPDDNTIEILVFNTLANHYQTIPSLYRGDPVSGLLGPVRILKFAKERSLYDDGDCLPFCQVT